MKKIMCLVLIFALVFSQSASGFAMNLSGKSSSKLSEMTDEECVAFVKDYNIEIPDDYEELGWAAFIRDTIAAVESDPDCDFVYSYRVMTKFANAIKAAVNDYYGVASRTTIDASARSTGYTLRYSVQYAGLYDDNYTDYNCYAYALGRNDFAWNPGEFSKEYKYNASDSVETVAQATKKDLLALGYSCVGIKTACPQYSTLASGQTAIALRKSGDFHYMRLSADGWLHKPGESVPLRYLYEANELPFWCNENIKATGVNPPTYYYDSEVYFLIYSNSHNYIYTTTGNQYHSGLRHYYEYADVCENCHNTINRKWVSQICSGPPCAIQYSEPPVLSTY